MKAISRWLDRFCYDHPNFGLSELMKYIAIGNVVVFVLDIFTRGYATWALMFSPAPCSTARCGGCLALFSSP